MQSTAEKALSDNGETKQACRILPDVQKDTSAHEMTLPNSAPPLYLDHIDETRKSVCRITIANKTASGFLVKIRFNSKTEMKGLLTNNHVISLDRFRDNASCSLEFEGLERARLNKLSITLKFRSGKHFFTDEGLDATFVQFEQRTIESLENNGAKWLLFGEEAKSGDDIFIVQHPSEILNGRMACASGKIEYLSGNDIIHLVNTEPGSSGSPVMNYNCQLVGLHKSAVHEKKHNMATKASSIETALRAHFEELNEGGKKLKPLPEFVRITSDEPDVITAENRRYARAKMPCDHVIGTVVLKEYCEKILSEGQTKIRCPDKNCSSEWEWFIVRHVLSSLYPKRCGEMEAKISENYFSSNSACKKCPGCRVWFTRLHTHIRSVRCVLCTQRDRKAFEFCWTCLGLWNRETNSCGNRTCANEE